MLNKIPNALINEFNSENVVLFIGSGLSYNANLPTWSNLQEQLNQQLMDLDDGTFKIYSSLDPLQKAQFLYDKSGKIAVINEIKKIFDRSVQESEIHKILATLPIKTIITTNWDELIEKCFEKYGKINIDTIWKDDQLSMGSNQVKLIKMHGTVQDPSSIVFSEDDYYNFLYTQTLLNQYILTIVATSTILFIGYSFSDFDFKLIFNYIRKKIGLMNKKPYIFLPNSNDFQINYLSKRGLKPIVFKDKDHKTATKSFFNELSSKVSIISIDAIDRLSILYREGTSILSKANSNLIIRNQSNLGPLSTPEIPKNPSLYGSNELTDLEIKCTQNWKQLIVKGGSAKCIACLEKNWILERYKPEDGLQRLQTLKENLIKYGENIEIVDIGIPITSNIEIYGKEICLESIKLGYRVKSYNKLKVFRKSDEINNAIENFDNNFEEIKKHNIKAAKELFPKSKSLLKDYIFFKIDGSINAFQGLIK